MAKWAGEFYERREDGTWRNRRTGEVLNTVTVKKRKGKTNQAIFFDGKNFKGVEPTKRHFFGPDARKSAKAKKKFEVRVKENKLNAKKRRSSHKRKV
jgi:hypothetical protein|tara:strand:+ start:15090 stop:15380 length:291 start_codon:yes stop_codon:yes gene_type:complete